MNDYRLKKIQAEQSLAVEGGKVRFSPVVGKRAKESKLEVASKKTNASPPRSRMKAARER